MNMRLPLLAVLLTGALIPPTVLAEEWQASWITTPSSSSNAWIAFRKTLELSEAPARATALVACDSKYWLWVNGELIVFEGGLKRGPTPKGTYFDRVPLHGKLRSGANVIAVLVWHFGREGMSHKDSELPGLVFQMTGGREPLLTDATWRTVRHPAYGETSEPKPNWRLPESNIHFDARRDLGDWTAHDFDDSDWPFAREVGTPPTEPWGQLVERPIPQWRNSGLLPYVDPPDFPLVSSGEPITLALPYNAQVTPYLKVEAKPGVKIDLRTDNYQGGGERNVRAEYITRGGVQEHESLGWMNGHKVVYAIPAGVSVLDLRYRETGYDTALAGDFECSDPRLNSLWRKAQRTLYLGMRDGYMDCPDRERAQWWGDVTSALQQAFYGLDRRSDRLARKAIRELAAWQKPAGVLFSPVPAGNWDKELPMQMLASVGRFGFWEYYRHTGDQETIQAVYPAVKRYMRLWELQDSGLVAERAGGWTWGDWGMNKDMPLLYNAWFYLALDGQQQMAELLGDTEQASDCLRLKQRIHESFNREFWTPGGYRSPSHQGPIDDRGNALAVVAGLACKEKYPVIRAVLKNQHHASPYMEKYVLEALIRMGDVDAALDRMLNRYGPMIDSPTTTLWEGWGIGPAGYGGGSYNHPWSGGPLTLLSQYVAGINPAASGYDSITIEPRLGRLRHLKATVCSPRGNILVVFRQDQEHGMIEGQVTIPNAAVATLLLPCAPHQAIQVSRPPGVAKSAPPVATVSRERKSIVLREGRHVVSVVPAAP